MALIEGRSVKIEEGLATVYYPNDGHCGDFKADGTRFKNQDSHIAHRWIPLGTKGVLCNTRTKLCTKTVVRDRGPFGALRRCQKSSTLRKIKWRKRCYNYEVQTKLKRGFWYRGKFDLTRPVAKAIKHRAFDKVIFLYTSSPHTFSS